MPNYIPLLVDGQAQAIALQVDADIASDNTNGFDAFTTNVVGTDNVDITDDDLLEAETDLNNVNAPMNDRFLVISPATRGSMMKIEAVRNSLYANTIGNIDGAKGAGVLGGVLSFQAIMSNNLEAGVAGKKNAAFQMEAIAYAEQLSVQTAKDLNIEDGVFNQWVTYQTCGFLHVKETFGVEVDSK